MLELLTAVVTLLCAGVSHTGGVMWPSDVFELIVSTNPTKGS